MNLFLGYAGQNVKTATTVQTDQQVEFQQVGACAEA